MGKLLLVNARDTGYGSQGGEPLALAEQCGNSQFHIKFIVSVNKPLGNRFAILQ